MFAVLLLFKIETVTKDFRLKIDFVSFHFTLTDFCQYISIVFFFLQWLYMKSYVGKLFLYCFYITSWISGLPDYISFISMSVSVPPQLMPFDLLLLELKFSSVLSTAVPVSGFILVLHRSVGSSLHLSLVSLVLSVKYRLPALSLKFVSEWKDLPSHSSHMTHHCTKSFLSLKR